MSLASSLTSSVSARTAVATPRYGATHKTLIASCALLPHLFHLFYPTRTHLYPNIQHHVSNHPIASHTHPSGSPLPTPTPSFPIPFSTSVTFLSPPPTPHATTYSLYHPIPPHVLSYSTSSTPRTDAKKNASPRYPSLSPSRNPPPFSWVHSLLFTRPPTPPPFSLQPRGHRGHPRRLSPLRLGYARRRAAPRPPHPDGPRPRRSVQPLPLPLPLRLPPYLPTTLPPCPSHPSRGRMGQTLPLTRAIPHLITEPVYNPVCTPPHKTFQVSLTAARRRPIPT